jgi:hypothetical protein
MSDFEDDIDDQLLELAGATEKKKKRRQPSNSNATVGGSGGGSKKRKAEYAFSLLNSIHPILLDTLGVVAKGTFLSLWQPQCF